MAELKLTNYLPASTAVEDAPHILELAHRLAYREASATLSSELNTRDVGGEEWMDLSLIDEDLEIAAISDPLEYLGLRGLLLTNRAHPTLFQIKQQ